MNKKIKVIELLKQMEIKENLPKQIKYKNKVFDLICSDDGIHYYANENWSMMNWIDNFYQLYEYVEILEDEDEIDIQNMGDLPIESNIHFYDNHSIKANRVKINELVRAVKQLDKKISKED